MNWLPPKHDVANTTCRLLHSERSIKISQWHESTENGQETQSHLVIQNARPSDEGNYTCKPSIFKTASVRLYVLDGKLWL